MKQPRKCILTVLLILLLSGALLAGCGSTAPVTVTAEPAEVTPSAEPEASTVQVSTVDELLAALAPDATIQLAPGTYNLTHASDYGEPVGGCYYTWENDGFSDGYSLRIQGADRLTLLGGDGVEIVTEPRTVHVLTFRGCSSLTLQGLTVGHTVEAEACQGGVIRLEQCENILLDCCRLYGCGTVGVWTEDVQGLTVSDCDIYHCSSSALYFSNSSGCSVNGGSVYDLGTSEAAQAVLYINNADNVSLDGLNIHDNTISDLVGGTDADGVKLSDLSVTGNRISTLFDCGGTMSLTSLTLDGNRIGSWFSANSDSPLILRLDGDIVHEEDLDTLWGEQLASAGVGTQEVNPAVIDLCGTDVVHVTTADEFIAALASDTTIYIDTPQLNLTDASGYSSAVSDDELYWSEISAVDFADTNAFFHTVYDGAELAIGNLQNVHIIGNPETGTEIVTEPRYAYVLRFYSCSNVTFENITLGHTVEPGYCTGGVLYLDTCSLVVLQNCDLYGCGIYGIEAWGCENIYVQSTQIHDCTYGAVWFRGCDSVAFIDSEIRNCPSPQITLDGCFSFTYNGVLMDDTCAFDMDADAVG